MQRASKTCVEAQCAANPKSGGGFEHKACLDIETWSKVNGKNQQEAT
jgi:hypothetical protein